MQILTWIWVAVAVLLLFGAAVFVHEFGHFWMARRRGLKVEGFSIGFGPKLFGWRRDGIDYAWRLIPAGGYVKLPQMVTSEALEGKTGSTEPLAPASPWSKILVAIAGPAMNGVFAVVIAIVIWAVGLPVLVNPAIIGDVDPASPEGKLGIHAGDRIVAVNGKPVKSWEDAQMIAAMAPTNLMPVEIERGATRNTYWVHTEVNPELGLKLLPFDPLTHAQIQEVLPGGAGEEAGLKAGDQVLSFAGTPIVGEEQLIRLIRARANHASTMTVARGKEHLRLTVTPRLDPVRQTGALGVMIAPSTTSVYQVQWPGPPPWVLIGDVCRQTFGTIAALTHSKQTGVGVKDLSGPPGILAMLAVQIKADFRLALKFMVLLNVSLAVLNLLPLPVLDGGHITLSLIEKLRGRPLSARFQEYATTVFAVLLISFMVYVSYNDVVKRFPLFRTMFKQQVQIEPGPGANGP